MLIRCTVGYRWACRPYTNDVHVLLDATLYRGGYYPGPWGSVPRELGQVQRVFRAPAPGLNTQIGEFIHNFPLHAL